MLNSTKFKAGDRVRRANGDDFSNGSYEVTVEKVYEYGDRTQVWLLETNTHIEGTSLVHATPTGDSVHQPNHYTQGGIETFDILKAKLTPAGYEGYLAGNILKYMTRYEHKNGLEDLQKAKVYLDKLIEVKQGV